MNDPRITLKTLCFASGLAVSLVLTGCAGAPHAAPPADKTIVSGILKDSSITIGIDSSSGFDLIQQGVNFDISKDGAVVARGFLMLKNDYDSYAAAAQSKEDYRETEINGYKTILYKEGTTSNALIVVPDSGTFIHIVDSKGQESLDAALKALSFKAGS